MREHANNPTDDSVIKSKSIFLSHPKICVSMCLSTKFSITEINSLAVKSDGTIFARNLHLVNDCNSETEQVVNLMTCEREKGELITYISQWYT